MEEITQKQGASLNSDKMRSTKIGKLIWQMSLPAIFSMLVQALYNIVDSIFVSNITQTKVGIYNGTVLGDDCFTAVSIVFPMTMFVIAIGIGIGVGANAYIARKLGEGNKEKASQAARNAVMLAVVAWLILLVLAFTVTKPFVKAFVNENNCSDPVFVAKQAQIYLTIYMAASLGSLLEITCNRILQATGNMRAPMISQLIGAITNIILDAVFILAFKWGVLGAILATVIGQWFAAAFTLSMFIFKKQDVSLKFRGFKLQGKYVSRILKVGMPAFIMNAMGSIITIILNSILAESATGIFVLSAYFKVQSFIFMPVFGLMQGTMPILSYNYGANLKHRFNQAFNQALIISVSIMVAGTILFQALPEQIMSILTESQQMIADGAIAFRIISIAFIPAAFAIVIINMLQSINKPMLSLFMSLCRQLIFLIPSAFILYNYFGQNGIWFCYVIAEVFNVIIFAPISIGARKKQFIRKQAQYDQGLFA